MSISWADVNFFVYDATNQESPQKGLSGGGFIVGGRYIYLRDGYSPNYGYDGVGLGLQAIKNSVELRYIFWQGSGYKGGQTIHNFSWFKENEDLGDIINQHRELQATVKNLQQEVAALRLILKGGKK